MGELKGIQQNPRDIANYAYQAGWRDAKILLIAVQVCLAESQGYDQAINENIRVVNGVKVIDSIDRGMWQLNSIHKWITDDIAYDPKYATLAAYKLWKSNANTFRPWVAFITGTYSHDTYLSRAARGVGNFLAEDGLKNQPKDYESTLPLPLLDIRK